MREGYEAYRNRIHSFVENQACFPPTCEPFCTAPGLVQKFDADGHFQKFYGDTTVFPLSKETQNALEGYQLALYNTGAHMLSEPLPAETFHITLHDLCAAGDKASIEKLILGHKQKLKPVLPALCQKGKFRLRSAGIVSMVASSVVMLFEPASEADHQVIQDIYGVIDSIVPLSYPLTLHCTLAYYRPGTYASHEWNPLLEAVRRLNQSGPVEIELDCSALEYQEFGSMKEYKGFIGNL